MQDRATQHLPQCHDSVEFSKNMNTVHEASAQEF